MVRLLADYFPPLPLLCSMGKHSPEQDLAAEPPPTAVLLLRHSMAQCGFPSRVPRVARELPVQTTPKTEPRIAFTRFSGEPPPPPLATGTLRRRRPAPFNPSHWVCIQRIRSDLNPNRPIPIRRSMAEDTGQPRIFCKRVPLFSQNQSAVHLSSKIIANKSFIF